MPRSLPTARLPTTAIFRCLEVGMIPLDYDMPRTPKVMPGGWRPNIMVASQANGRKVSKKRQHLLKPKKVVLQDAPLRNYEQTH